MPSPAGCHRFFAIGGVLPSAVPIGPLCNFADGPAETCGKLLTASSSLVLLYSSTVLLTRPHADGGRSVGFSVLVRPGACETIERDLSAVARTTSLHSSTNSLANVQHILKAVRIAVAQSHDSRSEGSPAIFDCGLAFCGRSQPTLLRFENALQSGSIPHRMNRSGRHCAHSIRPTLHGRTRLPGGKHHQQRSGFASRGLRLLPSIEA